MNAGFLTFRFNEAYKRKDEDGGMHTLAFETYDRPTLDDLNQFEAWLSDCDLALRCSETRLIPLAREARPGDPHTRVYFPERAFLRIEVSGILLDHSADRR